MALKPRAIGGVQRRGDIMLRPVLPNAGITAAYRRRLSDLIDEMAQSVAYWIEAAYKGNVPEVAALASDEMAATALRNAIKRLARRWLARFDEAAPKLADYFSVKASERVDGALKKILKDAGFSIEWTMTAAQRDILSATVTQNVSLIKSIPSEYFTKIEGAVMRSVQTGRDLGQLSKDLREQFGVSKRRAAFISRDQNAKATAAQTRARQLEIGVTEAIWVHSGGGKTQRASHVKAGQDRVRFDVAKGWLDPDEGRYILPGELINCRCTSRSVIRGFS
jgi:uncharacterized protein with gpF-like domain